MLGRWLGRLLLVGAIGALGWDLLDAVNGGPFSLSALGHHWFRLDPSSLNGLQAFVQRQLVPEIWDHALQPWLSAPSLVALGVPGLLLAILFRQKNRRIFGR